ncbi:hypothetical protein ACV35R_33730, partial [Pseudomonas aeruginosa]
HRRLQRDVRGQCDVRIGFQGVHVALEPSVQYIFNPDNYYNPGARELSGDGFVVGLQLMVDMGSLLGL